MPPRAYDVVLYYNELIMAVSNVDVAAGFATRVDLTAPRYPPVRGETVRMAKR